MALAKHVCHMFVDPSDLKFKRCICELSAWPSNVRKLQKVILHLPIGI
jgi:hypothetical protein